MAELQIKQALHEYIDTADDKKLEAIYTIPHTGAGMQSSFVQLRICALRVLQTINVSNLIISKSPLPKPATKKFMFFSTAGSRAYSQKLYNEDPRLDTKHKLKV